MELLEGIETRKSIRAFKSTPVSRETMERILKAAGNSPSQINTQPWEVAVVTGKKKEELSKIIYDLANSGTTPNPDVPFQATWPLEMEKRLGSQVERRFKSLGIERANEEQRKELRLANFKFFGAPCVLFILMDSTLGPWSLVDLGVFVQSIGLAAHSLGLGSCLQASSVGYPDAIRRYLDIPKNKKIILAISLGYPDFEARMNVYRSQKIGIEEFVKWY